MKKIVGVVLLMLLSQSVYAVDMDFYVYGDFDATVGGFRRAALIFADADYLGLFFIASVFGIFSGGITLFWRGLWSDIRIGQLLEYIFYPIMGMTLWATLIMQTGTMHIYDETQNKYEAVGGVPDGLVLVSGAFNKFERIVSEVASNNPATVRSSLASGTGVKMFLEAFANSPLSTAPELQKSLNNLVLFCVDISMKSNATLDLEYIRSQAPNARQVLTNIDNKAVATVVFDDNGVPTTMACDAASTNIIGRLDVLNLDKQTESLCLDAGYEIGGANAAAERAACYNQLENVGRVFLGASFGGSTRELFTNIAVYNTIANNINNANITVNGLGNRQIASEGIASLTVTEDWLPQIRGGMLVTILSMFLLISIFIVTPLFSKAVKVAMALFFFLAFWGASSSLLLMGAYDQVVYASRSISFHAGGLEAYLLAPTAAVQSLAIIGDSLSQAMMFAAALTTIFTGVSAYGFSNALAHAAGKVEGVGDSQGKNLTQEGKADLTEKNANSYATNQVAGAMGQQQYGAAHVQSAIEKNYSATGRADGIRQEGGIPSQVSHAEGLRQGGGMVPTSNLADPAHHGADSARVDIGGRLAQIQRASDAGDGNIMHGANKMELTHSSSAASTLSAHKGDISAIDKTSMTEAEQSKGHATGLRDMAVAGNSSAEEIGKRAGYSYGADHISSQAQYRTPEKVLSAAHAKASEGAGELRQRIADAHSMNPGASTSEAMYDFGQNREALSNNTLLGSQELNRNDLIQSEEFSMIDRVANSKMNNALAQKYFTAEGGELDTDSKIKAALSQNPLRSLAIGGADMIETMREQGYGHLANSIDPNQMTELTAAMTLSDNGELEFGNMAVSQGAKTIYSEEMNTRSGSTTHIGDDTNIGNRLDGNTLANAVGSYEQNPAMLEQVIDQIGNMSPADQLQAFEGFNASLPTPFHGNLATQDTFTFNTGLEAHAGASSGLLEQVGIDAGARTITQSYNDNSDSREIGASVKVAGIQMLDKFNEIASSHPSQDGNMSTEPGLLGVNPEQHLKTERFANYLSSVYQASLSEGEKSISNDDVNRVNDYDSGKSGNILRDLNAQETRQYRSLGWETGKSAEVDPSPEVKAAQLRQQQEYESMMKKIDLTRVN
jgi:hypothetical protein